MVIVGHPCSLTQVPLASKKEILTTSRSPSTGPSLFTKSSFPSAEDVYMALVILTAFAKTSLVFCMIDIFRLTLRP